MFLVINSLVHNDYNYNNYYVCRIYSVCYFLCMYEKDMHIYIPILVRNNGTDIKILPNLFYKIVVD